MLVPGGIVVADEGHLLDADGKQAEAPKRPGSGLHPRPTAAWAACRR
jgi:hypothetical protein